MNLVASLLNAILRLDGDALVMHVGDKPYVVAPSGQVELATRPLALDAVSGMMAQLLPAESQRALDEFGAVQHEFPPTPEFPTERFTVVAARGGDDVWVEIRRRRPAFEELAPPAPVIAAAPAPPAIAPVEPAPASSLASTEPATTEPVVAETAATEPVVAKPAGGESVVAEPAAAKPTVGAAPVVAGPVTVELAAEPVVIESAEAVIAVAAPVVAAPEVEPTETEPAFAAFAVPAADVVPEPAVEIVGVAFVESVVDTTVAFDAGALDEPTGGDVEPTASAAADSSIVDLTSEIGAPEIGMSTDMLSDADAAAPLSVEPMPPAEEPSAAPAASEIEAPPAIDVPVTMETLVMEMPADVSEAPSLDAEVPAREAVNAAAEPVRPPAHSAVVVPMARGIIRGEMPPSRSAANGLDRLLRMAAARGASTLYLSSQSQPSVRVDGEIRALDEPPLGPGEVESLLVDVMPERNREALRSGVSTEWICDVADVGRVRCMTFRDHRGPGGIFRMMPMRAISADQLGLSPEVQALAAEAEGLVIVAGPRSSGKSTLISAFVDLINRTRRDHVITIESELKVVHERRSSLISQREIRGGGEEMTAAARAALREDPDVLVLEDLRSAELIAVALEAAASGRLVLGALPAHNATDAVDRIIDACSPEERRRVQLELAETLRGIVAQELIRRPGGGRSVAREVLLNTRSVASLVAEGKTSQLTAAMEDGRKYGMVPQNDALVALVQSGLVDAREAYRRAADRPAFLALLQRQGVETSFVERIA